jgi:hypothetical protein
MKSENLRRAAVFFGVVLPALSAGAKGGNGDAALEEAVIDACLQVQEKTFECKEVFVDAMLDHHVKKSGASLTPEERAKMREARLKDIVAGVSGTVERRRGVCKKLIDRMGERAKEEAKGSSLKTCLAEPDCQARTRCLMPIIEAVHHSEAPPKKK